MDMVIFMIEKILEEMKPYQIVKQQTLNTLKGNFLALSQERFTLANGTTIPRECIQKKNTHAIMVIPETIEHRFVMVIQPRPFSKTGVSIEFPAGYVEQEEGLEEAAKRELEEETGYHWQEVHPITSYYQDIGCSRAQISLFHAKNCEKKTVQHLDDSEMITFIEVSFQELLELFQNGMVCDANSVTCLFYLLSHQKGNSFFFKD